MRRNLFVSGLIIVLGAFSLSLMPFKGAKAEVEHGKTGLRFTVQGLDWIRLEKVKCGIGFKSWMTDNMAFRSSFGFGFSDTTDKATDEDFTDEKWKSVEFSLDAGAEFHPLIGKKVSPFFGFGINFSTSTHKWEPSIHKTDPYPYETKSEKWTLIGFGGEVFVGAEFFMGNHLSLTGEYDLGLSLGTGKYKEELVGGDHVEQPKEQKMTSFDLGVNTASLILSIYF